MRLKIYLLSLIEQIEQKDFILVLKTVVSILLAVLEEMGERLQYWNSSCILYSTKSLYLAE